MEHVKPPVHAIGAHPDLVLSPDPGPLVQRVRAQAREAEHGADEERAQGRCPRCARVVDVSAQSPGALVPLQEGCEVDDLGCVAVPRDWEEDRAPAPREVEELPHRRGAVAHCQPTAATAVQLQPQGGPVVSCTQRLDARPLADDVPRRRQHLAVGSYDLDECVSRILCVGTRGSSLPGLGHHAVGRR